MLTNHSCGRHWGQLAFVCLFCFLLQWLSCRFKDAKGGHLGERVSVVSFRACHLQEVRRSQKTEASYVPQVYKD